MTYVIDLNECQNISICKKDVEECINTEGSYKCVSKVVKKLKVLQDMDYDAEGDNEGDNYYEESTTIIAESCELGYEKNDSNECVGKVIVFVVYILTCF